MTAAFALAAIVGFACGAAFVLVGIVLIRSSMLREQARQDRDWNRVPR